MIMLALVAMRDYQVIGGSYDKRRSLFGVEIIKLKIFVIKIACAVFRAASYNVKKESYAAFFASFVRKIKILLFSNINV